MLILVILKRSDKFKLLTKVSFRKENTVYEKGSSGDRDFFISQNALERHDTGAANINPVIVYIMNDELL